MQQYVYERTPLLQSASSICLATERPRLPYKIPSGTIAFKQVLMDSLGNRRCSCSAESCSSRKRGYREVERAEWLRGRATPLAPDQRRRAVVPAATCNQAAKEAVGRRGCQDWGSDLQLSRDHTDMPGVEPLPLPPRPLLHPVSQCPKFWVDLATCLMPSSCRSSAGLQRISGGKRPFSKPEARYFNRQKRKKRTPQRPSRYNIIITASEQSPFLKNLNWSPIYRKKPTKK